MNTNRLKASATEARLILIEGVTRKLDYWGFNKKGECTEEMIKISGGYEFREQVFNDERVYPKWQNLKRHIKDEFLP